MLHSILIQVINQLILRMNPTENVLRRYIGRFEFSYNQFRYNLWPGWLRCWYRSEYWSYCWSDNWLDTCPLHNRLCCWRSIVFRQRLEMADSTMYWSRYSNTSETRIFYPWYFPESNSKEAIAVSFYVFSLT